jgi:hypothetical protein
MAPLPNFFLCSITYVITREKQRKQRVGGAIADGETDAKTRVLTALKAWEEVGEDTEKSYPTFLPKISQNA